MENRPWRKNRKCRLRWSFRTVTINSKYTVWLSAAASLLVWQRWPRGTASSLLSQACPRSPPQPWAICWHCEVGQKRTQCSQPAANDAKQVGPRAEWSKVKAQRNPTALFKAPSIPGGDLPNGACTIFSKNRGRDHENRCCPATHKGNRYFNTVSLPA